MLGASCIVLKGLYRFAWQYCYGKGLHQLQEGAITINGQGTYK